MGYNFKKILLRRSATFLLILSFTSSALYLPTFAPRAEAFLGIADFGFTIDVKALAREIADGIAMVAAQKMVDSMVNSTVEWAQSGFDGNPAYVTDPKQYFTDLSDGIAGEYIANNEKLNFLCSPFQVQVRIALQRTYTGYGSNYFQCTLTDVVANIDAFYEDFSEGGWDGWLAMTQNSSNNPYGAYIEASLDMNSRLASAVSLKKEQLTINTGFLNTEKCPAGAEEIDDGLGNKNCFEMDQNGQRHQVSKQTVTPGALVKNQLDKALPSGMEKLITLEHVEQLISSVLNGLVTKYVVGPGGLFSRGSRPDQPPPSVPPPQVQQPNPCDALRELYGDDVECNPDGDPEPEDEDDTDNPDEPVIEQ